MAIIYTYPIVTPTSNDLVLGTDVDAQGKPTKNFTIQSIIDLVTVSGNDLQAVLDNGNTATQNIVLTGNISATNFTDGTITISGGDGTGFINFQSTNFAGDLTGVIKAGSSIEGTVTGVTQNQGDDSTKLATTAYVDNQVDPSVLQYLGDATGPFDLNLVNDDFKISGTANQIETTATTVGGNIGTINLKFPTTGVTLPDGSTATTQALTDNSTDVATTAFVKAQSDALDLDFIGDTGTSSVLLNSQTLDFEGTTNQITTAVSAQKVKFTLPTNVTIGGVFTGTTFSGDLNGTVNTATTGTTQSAGDDSTKIATTAYVDTAAGAKILQYQGDTGGPFDLNLKDDDLDIAGGSNISTTAATVATNLGVITIDLNDSVTISGTSKADTFTTTLGVATWVTTVLDGFTAITSDLFTGPLVGNADTATALASSGALSFGGEVTLSSSSPSPATYTSGGNITLNLGLNNAAVTGKVLTGLVIPASGSSVVPSDTILSGIGKLQAQVNTGATGLRFMGSWNASMDTGGTDNTPDGTPALTSGGGLATSGTNSSVTTGKLTDSSASFSSTVTANDRVYNEAGAFTTITSIDSNTELTLVDDIFLTTGQAYTIDNDPALSQGEYYVVSAVGASEARNATLNSIQNWQVGDWVIAGASNVWERLDQTSVEGSGTAGRIAKFSDTSVIADSIILEESGGIKLDSGKTLTTQGTGGSLTVGGAATISGLTTAGAALSLTGGVNLPTGAYGTVGQVLTNDASPSATTDLIWTTPTTGTVESVTAGDGIVMTGDAVDPVVNIDYLGTDNAILSATDISTGSIATTDQIWFNDVNTGTVTNTLKYAPVSKLPFDSYDKWVLRGDNYDAAVAATSQDVDSEEVMTVAGGTIIDTVVGATRKVTINHGDLSVTQTDNTGTPLTPAFGGAIELVASASGTGQGHMDTVVTNEITLPSPVNFTAGTAPGAGTPAAGTAGYVPAPAAGTGSTAYFLNGTGTMSIPPNDDGVTAVTATAPISSSGGDTPNITHDNSGVTAGTYDSVAVDAKGHVTGGSNPGGSGGGIFSGDQAITVAGGATLAFTLTRATTGTLIFDVWLTSETSTATSVAKKYTVAHSYDIENPVYNKIIDTGPGTGNSNTNDFNVSFINSDVGAVGTSCKCILTAVGADQNIGYTVQVGHDSTNALTFTAAS